MPRALIRRALQGRTDLTGRGRERNCSPPASVHDFPVLMGCALVAGAATAAWRLVADILYAIANPRILTWVRLLAQEFTSLRPSQVPVTGAMTIQSS